MIKIKTSELTGAALDWAVAQCVDEPVEVRGRDIYYQESQFGEQGVYCPSESWEQGGPIMEKYDIFPSRYYGCEDSNTNKYQAGHGLNLMLGETPLVAAMRALVFIKLGAKVDVPDVVGV